MAKGVVKFYKLEKGWGAVSSPELPPGKDAFLHFSVLDPLSVPMLRAGDALEFTYSEAQQDSFDFVVESARVVIDSARPSERRT